MRISDCSSYLCSSDLPSADQGWRFPRLSPLLASPSGGCSTRPMRPGPPLDLRRYRPHRSMRRLSCERSASAAPHSLTWWHSCAPRSEENTSELQSLMRTSSAVLCLKKKNNQCKIHY